MAHCGPCSFAWAGAVWPVTSKRCAGGRRYATIRHVSRAEVREKASHHASGPAADTRKRISFLHPFAFSVSWRLAFSGGPTRRAGCREIATGGRIKTEALWQCGVPVFFVIIACDLAGFFFCLLAGRLVSSPLRRRCAATICSGLLCCTLEQVVTFEAAGRSAAFDPARNFQPRRGRRAWPMAAPGCRGLNNGLKNCCCTLSARTGTYLAEPVADGGLIPPSSGQ